MVVKKICSIFCYQQLHFRKFNKTPISLVSSMKSGDEVNWIEYASQHPQKLKLTIIVFVVWWSLSFSQYSASLWCYAGLWLDSAEDTSHDEIDQAILNIKFGKQWRKTCGVVREEWVHGQRWWQPHFAEGGPHAKVRKIYLGEYFYLIWKVPSTLPCSFFLKNLKCVRTVISLKRNLLLVFRSAWSEKQQWYS